MIYDRFGRPNLSKMPGAMFNSWIVLDSFTLRINPIMRELRPGGCVVIIIKNAKPEQQLKDILL